MILQEVINSHIQGEWRWLLLVSEWIIGLLAMELALFFFIRTRSEKLSKIKFNQEIAYAWLFLGYAMSYVFFIRADYYVDDSQRMFFYSLGYLSLMVGALFFLYTMEKSKTYIKKYFFTTLFIILISVFLLVFVFAFEYTQTVSYMFYPIFILYFMIYFRSLVKLFYKKEGLSKFMKDFAKLFLGFSCLIVGYGLTTDIMVSIFNNSIRFLGNIFQMFGFIGMYLFFISVPKFSELDWQEKIEKLFLINKSGLFIYKKNFREADEQIDQHIIAGLLTSIKMILQTLTERDGISTIEKEGKIVIIHPGKLVTGVIICSESNYSLKILLNKYIDKVERIYEKVLKDWKGNLDIFGPLDNLTKEIFF